MSAISNKFFAIVAGAGPGTGRAAAVRFSRAYPVVVLARRAESYDAAVKDITAAGGQAVGVEADVSDEASMTTAFQTIAERLPGRKLAAAIFNASGGFARKPFLEVNVDELESSLQVNARGLFIFAQKTLPLLLDAVGESEHPPSLLVTGATASSKSSATFSTFASGMFARRALSQSLAREFGPKGVHVAHAIIDGVIDIPRTRQWPVNNGVEDGKISPESIADNYWHLHTQPRSAFTWELDIRPFVEKW